MQEKDENVSYLTEQTYLRSKSSSVVEWPEHGGILKIVGYRQQERLMPRMHVLILQNPPFQSLQREAGAT